MPDRLNVYVVSDATGATALQVVTSVLVQYPDAPVTVHRFPFVREEEKLRRLVESMPPGTSMMVTTFVSPEMSAAAHQLGEEKGVRVADLMGPLFETFSKVLDQLPRRTPGILTHRSEEEHNVAEAIHFALKHDDGLGLDTLDQAELLILGVSRTGKTPTSLFLACRGVKVANLPVVDGIPLPEEVRLHPVKKVGFRIELERLRQLRSRRRRRMGAGMLGGYATPDRIFAELEYCNTLFRKIPGLRTIDVTDHSVEEVSDWITHNVL
jgi:regulator of PEP synthase PpsR (kinase-PPPase family)